MILFIKQQLNRKRIGGKSMMSNWKVEGLLKDLEEVFSEEESFPFEEREEEFYSGELKPDGDFLSNKEVENLLKSLEEEEF